MKGSQERQLEPASRSEQGPYVKSSYRLAPYGLFNLLSYSTQDHLLKGVMTHSGVGLLTVLINQANTQEPEAQSDHKVAKSKLEKNERDSMVCKIVCDMSM